MLSSVRWIRPETIDYSLFDRSNLPKALLARFDRELAAAGVEPAKNGELGTREFLVTFTSTTIWPFKKQNLAYVVEDSNGPLVHLLPQLTGSQLVGDVRLFQSHRLAVLARQNFDQLFEARLTNDQGAEELNELTLDQLTFVRPRKTNLRRAHRVSRGTINDVANAVKNNRVTSLRAYRKYVGDTRAGFCWGRAMAAQLYALLFGVALPRSDDHKSRRQQLVCNRHSFR